MTLSAALAFTLSIAGLKAQADEKEIPIDKVPKAVIDAVKKKFPTIQIKSATEETEDGKVSYEIESTVNGANTDIVLKADGTIEVIEKEIKEKDLPAPVLATLKSKYPTAKVTKYEELTKGTDVTYEMAFEGGSVKEVVIDKTGKVVDEEKAEEKKKD
jgi:hypothetical protein